MSSFHGIKYRDNDSRRGTIRNALDEQTDYEQVRFRWLFGFIHVRHFFAFVQVVALYVFTPFILLCGSASESCPSTLFGETLSTTVQTLFLMLGVIVVLCVIFSSIAFHWTEKLRYMNSPYQDDRFCHLSPMPFVALFFVHQIFIFAILIFYLYTSLFQNKFQFSNKIDFLTHFQLITGSIIPFVLFMGLMVYIIYGDFRLWSYACFVREHTKLKRRLAKIDEERGYKSGLGLGNFSRVSRIGSNRSLGDVIGSNSIRAKIQRYRQSLSRNSITSENNSFHQNSLRNKPPQLTERMDEAGDNPLPHIASFASSNEQSLNESRDSRGRRFLPRSQYNAMSTQSPPSTVRLQRNPIYTTTDNSDIELMHVLDTIGEVNEENHSG